jgi:hypothetical protein
VADVFIVVWKVQHVNKVASAALCALMLTIINFDGGVAAYISGGFTVKFETAS